MKTFSQYIEKTVEDYYKKFDISIVEEKEEEKESDPEDVDKESVKEKVEDPKKKKRKKPIIKKREDMALSIPKAGK